MTVIGFNDDPEERSANWLSMLAFKHVAQEAAKDNYMDIAERNRNSYNRFLSIYTRKDSCE